MPPVTTLLEAPLISPNVGLKMYRLDRRPENGAMNPDKNNIFNKNIARLVASQNYGIKIVNKSDYSLYPYLFSFDPSDYTIEPLYQPPFTAETAPLKPGGFVTIGYGGAGGAPLQFQAPEGASDACFLKLIVSTQNIKLDHMVQSSVFKIPSKHDGSDDEPPIGVPRAKPTRAVHDVFWDMSLAILIVAPPVPSIGTAIWGRVARWYPR
ncbi:hypothetical protein B0H10DRAFT_907875 [Mycena sp. CBHHK59/15]|nr:hypothetical protein B0H10DRAFT_907875 [Mycena sp. CBHHK59/15]